MRRRARKFPGDVLSLLILKHSTRYDEKNMSDETPGNAMFTRLRMSATGVANLPITPAASSPRARTAGCDKAEVAVDGTKEKQSGRRENIGRRENVTDDLLNINILCLGTDTLFHKLCAVRRKTKGRAKTINWCFLLAAKHIGRRKAGAKKKKKTSPVIKSTRNY